MQLSLYNQVFAGVDVPADTVTEPTMEMLAVKVAAMVVLVAAIVFVKRWKIRAFHNPERR